MNDKTNELKTCPFCGGAVVHLGYSFIQANYAECQACLANIRGNKTEDEAIERWNRRYDHAAAELRWIPVKTRYPDRSGVYDVTFYDGTISKSAFYVGAFDKSVIAWMPPPSKPYTEPADNIGEGV